MPRGDQRRMIVRARVVVTMDGPPIENGAVVISGNRIADIGKFPEISSRHSGQELVDLGEQALLPGLINAHCHVDYTCLRGKISPQKSFADWDRAARALYGFREFVPALRSDRAAREDFAHHTSGGVARGDVDVSRCVRAALRILKKRWAGYERLRAWDAVRFVH